MTATPGIDAMTIGQTGWTKIDRASMRWVSEPLPGVGGRHVLQIKGRGHSLGVSTAWLPPEIDPADAEAVADALDTGWESVLPLAALIVLRSAIDSAVTAIEAAR